MATATILVCPNCDSTLERTTKKCDYCHQPVIVDSGDYNRMDFFNQISQIVFCLHAYFPY